MFALLTLGPSPLHLHCPHEPSAFAPSCSIICPSFVVIVFPSHGVLGLFYGRAKPFGHPCLPRSLRDEDLRLPGPKVVSSPPAGYVVSFVHFHEQGFAMPPLHPFLVGILHYYKVQLHYVRGIWDSVSFPRLVSFLLRRTITGRALARWANGDNADRVRHSDNIDLQGTRLKSYIPLRLCSSDKGWHG